MTQKPKTILLVEDDLDDEDLTRRALERSHLLNSRGGFAPPSHGQHAVREANLAPAAPLFNQLVVVRDGAEALEYIFGEGRHAGRDVSELPEVVLLDLKLPRVDGLEVLRRIRTDLRTRELPVVVLTSSREEKDVVESYRLGANSYVQKPVHFDEFLEAVRTLGFYWLILNVRPARS